ncbi:hypothetical protein L8106_27519 [Lyngbya sp. PCC 8106]|nr:hypothetical protein L8106_27519 [Lyngbya sp. PCC 8106]
MGLNQTDIYGCKIGQLQSFHTIDVMSLFGESRLNNHAQKFAQDISHRVIYRIHSNKI